MTPIRVGTFPDTIRTNMQPRCGQRRRALALELLEDRRMLATIPLSALTASQGITLFGADPRDESGFSVSRAGDVNRDGFDDWLIGAPHANGSTNNTSNAGEAYLVFGSAVPPATIDLANVGTTIPGTKLFGLDIDDVSGMAVSAAGDVNGDGFQDLIVGAYEADGNTNGKPDSGESFLIFGKSVWPATINLSSVGITTPGVRFLGADAGDYSGCSVGAAGDINGDGFDDLIIGAYKAYGANNTNSFAGKSYLIFGAASFAGTIDLSTIGVTVAGAKFFGSEANDFSGRTVNGAGDINGDGFDDLVIAAPYADASTNSKSEAGDVYVVFGGQTIPTAIDLTDVGTTVPGMILFGSRAGDYSGRSVSGAGDVNGDGFDDLLIGAIFGDAKDNLKLNAGDSFLVFGSALPPATVSLASVGGSVPGIKFYGADTLDNSGRSVSSAGDVNGDGFDDLLIGAYSADGSGNLKSNAGDSYVVFGAATMPIEIDQANVGVSVPGIVLFGIDKDDFSGRSVSGAGDVNGDGFSDFLIGAHQADALNNGRFLAGESYLIYGSDFTSSVTQAGTPASETLNGSVAANIMVGGRGNDILVGAGGADVQIGGQGNDVLAVSDLTFRRIIGGTGDDTLRLDGSGMTLNLTTLRDNRMKGIETIDITGSGVNTITLNQREVLNLSNESNRLIVRRNVGDVVNMGSGWTQGSNQTIGPDIFEVFSQGAATLFITDTTPPKVTDIIASGAAWSAGLIDAVDGGGTGSGNGLGYSLTSGLTIPNTGINRIYIQFSEPVVGFGGSNVALFGVNVADYSGISTVTYDSLNMRGVIQLSTSIAKDKLRIGVSDAVKDTAMNALDGDSNTLAGGVLNFRFNVLIGDANNDGSVNGGDLPIFAASFNKSVGNVAYNSRADWNSDGSVNGGDLPLFSSNFNQSLPAAEPGSLNFPPPPPALIPESSLAPPIDEVDEFFTQLDDEKEFFEQVSNAEELSWLEN